MMDAMQEILAKLISFQSITPRDAGCQEYMVHYLKQLGFQCHQFDKTPVANFFAQLGSRAPLLVFAGHTDVVPIGERGKWVTDPFVLTEQDGMLYGRGTADMKGSLAAMLIATSRFVQLYPQFAGSIGFLITSGEEGDDFDLGTPYVMAQLKQQGIQPQFCIVGEPSSTNSVGDVIKIGRRGSLTGTLILQGKQGHVAYPHLADNPIHKISPVLAELTATQWDKGNTYFPPTTFQITHLQAGGQANNIIPGELNLSFNFRFSTEQTALTLQKAVQACFERHGLSPSINWRINGEPFLTAKGRLLDSCIKVITAQTGKAPELSTSGGTSDGRFIAPYGVEVVELGPVNATIHQVNECVALADLHSLSEIYFALCVELLTNN